MTWRRVKRDAPAVTSSNLSRTVREGADVVSLLLVAGWLLFPVRYSFTEQGVGLHTGAFWDWESFGSYRRAGGIVQLRRAGGGGVSLYLNHPQQQAILPLLRRHIAQRRSH